jgi:hypothetical protein
LDSPYLSRLLAQRQAAEDPHARALVDAEIGMYRARCGEVEIAESIARGLRTEFGDGRSVRVSVMLMALEALVIYFKDLSAKSHDRMSRAHLLSIASKRSELVALTGAWLAHIDFNFERYREMVRAIGDCVHAASAEDDHSLCRLSLTLGDAFLITGNERAAKGWYQRAHAHAIRLGDHASIGALTYNQAALRVFMTRLNALTAPIDPPSLTLLSGEVKNAINYQAIARLQSLQSLLDSALISLRILSSDYAFAASAIESLLVAESRVRVSDSRTGLRCDLAMCYAKLGRHSEAADLLRSIPLESVDALNADDRAIAYSSLRDASTECGQKEVAEAINQKCREAAREHGVRMSELAESLGPFTTPQVLPPCDS